ncbi:MAG: trypsin-like peptidase domain-containing protein [Anaerolineales bacterium]|nr:trypsin-like peptidase domain-containing protein [Anaerolineales bacterium]
MTTSLTSLSDALADTVANAAAGVVRVEARRRLAASGILWNASGTIVTANHVVRKDGDVTVGLADGTAVSARLVGRDPSTDLAVLQADLSGAAALPHAAADATRVGNLVLALGRPGQSVQATFGIVSALGGSWRTGMGGHVDQYLQTDVLMYPGFSGGPLVNAHGQLVGLNSSALMQGVSLALPTATLARVVAALQAHGHVRRGYLGVSTQRVHLPESAREALGQKAGLLIVSVEKDSPAEQGGLTLGDTIVSLDGSAVGRHDDLVALLSGDRVGQKVPVSILRGGEVRTLNVVVGERPS